MTKKEKTSILNFIFLKPIFIVLTSFFDFQSMNAYQSHQRFGKNGIFNLTSSSDKISLDYLHVSWLQIACS